MAGRAARFLWNLIARARQPGVRPTSKAMKTIRWILVPVAGFAGYYLAMLSGMALFFLGTALCPKDQISSGMCGAPWFPQYMRAIMFAGPSLAATFMILGASFTAPSHRRIVAAATLALGSGLALAIGRRGFFLAPAALSVLVGGILTALIWRRDAPPQAEPSNSISFKIVGAVGALVCCVILFGVSSVYFSRKIGKGGPHFGRGPFTEKDVPRLLEAIKKKDNEVEAVYALGKVGPAAAPAVPLLLEMIDSANQDLAMAAFSALEHIGPGAKDAIPILRKCGIKGECGRWRMIRESIKALGGIGDVEGVVTAGASTDYYQEHGVADAVKNYDLVGPGLKEVLVRLFQSGSSDYVKESAALSLSKIAPDVPGLVEYFRISLEKDSKQFAQLKDPAGGAGQYNLNRIKETRAGLTRIGSQEAKLVLEKYPEPSGSNHSVERPAAR